MYHAWRKHQTWSSRLGTRKDKLGDDIFQKTGLIQLCKQLNPDSAEAAFLILFYPCPSTDQYLGANRAVGLLSRIRDRRMKTLLKVCQKCLGSNRQKSVPERKDTCVKRLIFWTGGTFRDKHAPELEPQSLLKPSLAARCYTHRNSSLPRKPSSQGLVRHTDLGGTFLQERLGQAKGQCHVFRQLAHLQVCWAPGTEQPHADPRTALHTPGQLPPHQQNLPRSPPTFALTGKYDNYLPKGVSGSMTTYQTWTAPTLLRGDLQGKRQLNEGECASVLLKQHGEVQIMLLQNTWKLSKQQKLVIWCWYFITEHHLLYGY